jgi:MarR family transcriptional regulator, lower aerobic nicotinate degradation pathway regulator
MAPPPPAPDDQASPTTDALVQLSFVLHTEMTGVAADHDLSLVQLRMLGVLRDRRPTMARLAQHLGLTKSSLTGLIDRAEHKDLVRRVADRADGRTVRVELTRHGRALATRATAAANRDVDLLLADLSAAQRAQLTRLAGQVVDRAHHATGPCSSPQGERTSKGP